MDINDSKVTQYDSFFLSYEIITIENRLKLDEI